MKFEFEFLNIHICHLKQLGMINITSKFQEKTYVKKFTVFTIIRHGFWLLGVYLHPVAYQNKSMLVNEAKHPICIRNQWIFIILVDSYTLHNWYILNLLRPHKEIIHMVLE
jgi:hypothetical protein